jgi:hypothetical protein
MNEWMDGLMNEWMSLSHSFRLDTHRLDWRWHDGIGADRSIDIVNLDFKPTIH